MNLHSKTTRRANKTTTTATTTNKNETNKTNKQNKNKQNYTCSNRTVMNEVLRGRTFRSRGRQRINVVSCNHGNYWSVIQDFDKLKYKQDGESSDVSNYQTFA